MTDNISEFMSDMDEEDDGLFFIRTEYAPAKQKEADYLKNFHREYYECLLRKAIEYYGCIIPDDEYKKDYGIFAPLVNYYIAKKYGNNPEIYRMLNEIRKQLSIVSDTMEGE